MILHRDKIIVAPEKLRFYNIFFVSFPISQVYFNIWELRRAIFFASEFFYTCFYYAMTCRSSYFFTISLSFGDQA